MYVLFTRLKNIHGDYDTVCKEFEYEEPLQDWLTDNQSLIDESETWVYGYRMRMYPVIKETKIVTSYELSRTDPGE
mgnify:CR=1 FL=1